MRRIRPARTAGAAVVTLAMVATACGRTATVTPPSTSGVSTSVATTVPVVVPEGFPTGRIVLDGVPMAVYVADTPARRRRGLMEVTDLAGKDGMLFVFDADSDAGFWMKDTVMPLDIAFFDAAGGYVDGFTMMPCRADPCPVYTPGGIYRYALEAAAGRLAAVGPSSRLVVEG